MCLYYRCGFLYRRVDNPYDAPSPFFNNHNNSPLYERNFGRKTLNDDILDTPFSMPGLTGGAAASSSNMADGAMSTSSYTSRVVKRANEYSVGENSGEDGKDGVDKEEQEEDKEEDAVLHHTASKKSCRRE